MLYLLTKMASHEALLNKQLKLTHTFMKTLTEIIRIGNSSSITERTMEDQS